MGRAHLHLFALDEADEAPWSLSREEEERAARFHFPQDHARWRLGRHRIRQTLARHVGLAAEALVFRVDDRGRPSLALAPADFDCNWSHSGPWLVLAVSRHGRVGVDLEMIRDDFPALEVAEAFFTASEIRALRAAPDQAARQELFYALWTAKEALMKGTGLGAALEPGSIEVALHEGQPCRYASHPEWRLHFHRGPGWALALAEAGTFLPATAAA